MCPFQVAGHVLEVIFNDKIGITEFDPSAVLVTGVSHLIVTVSLLCIEAEVLCEVEQERAVVTRCGEFGRPAVGGITTDNKAGVAVVLASHGPILVIRLYLQDDNVRLPHQVLLVLKSLQHSLNRVPALTDIALRVDLHWFDSLLDNWVIREVEIEDNL